MKKHLALFTIILGLVFYGCASDKELLKKTKEGDIEVTVTSEKLINDYKANEVKADDMYKDKVIAVSGKVAEIKKDLGGFPILLLSASKKWIKVHCKCAKETSSKVAKINKGDTVTVKGVCLGKLGNINLGGCIPQ